MYTGNNYLLKCQIHMIVISLILSVKLHPDHLDVLIKKTDSGNMYLFPESILKQISSLPGLFRNMRTFIDQ